MTPTELRALDLEMAEKYLGNTAVPFNPTTEEFDSFVLLRKLGERFEMLEICIYKTPHCQQAGNRDVSRTHSWARGLFVCQGGDAVNTFFTANDANGTGP